MLQNIAAIIVTIGILALLFYLLDTYIPTIPRLIRALIVASVLIGTLRVIHEWACSLICRP